MMNWMLIISGSVALFTTVGHFAIGTRHFLQPMLASTFDEVARKVMHCVFHYVSTFLVLSSAALFYAGFQQEPSNEMCYLVRFISLNYGVFAVWQLLLACLSGIPNAIMKLFQWIFFVAIAVTAWIGS